ncbi:wHTH domain-containing protein [Streptomyces sp. NPDC002911]
MSHTSDGFDPDAQLLTSAHLDRRGPWLDPTGPVPPYHLLQAALTTGRSPAEARDRFAELGYQVPTPEELAALPADAVKLVSFNLDGAFPWVRRPRTPVPRVLPRIVSRTARSAAGFGVRRSG